MKNNQLYDKLVFEETAKIILSKSVKPKEGFTKQMIRYNEATEKLDVIGCAKVLNELKIHFDGTRVKEKSVAKQMMFIKALRILAEVYSYHNGDKKDKHWDNASKILKSINISEDNEGFRDLRIYFQGTI